MLYSKAIANEQFLLLEQYNHVFLTTTKYTEDVQIQNVAGLLFADVSQITDS